MADTNRIEKRLFLKASQARVWRALSSAEEFGTWFGMAVEGQFVAGAVTRGVINSKRYGDFKIELQIEKIEPQRYFSYRWHPFAVDSKIDYSKEQTTLVEFSLKEAEGGTWLTVTESGFDHIPASRREEAFRMNDGGWAAQLENIEEHVALP